MSPVSRVLLIRGEECGEQFSPHGESQCSGMPKEGSCRHEWNRSGVFLSEPLCVGVGGLYVHVCVGVYMHVHMCVETRG